MVQVLVNVRKDEESKRDSIDVSVDPFYSDENMNYLKKVITEIESGKSELKEHELIED